MKEMRIFQVFSGVSRLSDDVQSPSRWSKFTRMNRHALGSWERRGEGYDEAIVPMCEGKNEKSAKMAWPRSSARRAIDKSLM